MIRVEHLDYEIGATAILRDVAFKLESGRITGILGANGAGKSTLLRLLSGALKPSRGGVFLDERPLGSYGRRELAKRRAWMPQERQGGELLCVRQYVEIGRYCHSEASSEEHLLAVEAALDQFDLQPLSGRPIGTLSGGERQRCDWALIWAQTELHRAAVGKILMLDEPTAALDWGQAQRALDIMESARDRGASLIVILHDLNLARLYCDEVLLLHRARIFARGKPSDVLSAQRVAECFGARVSLDSSGSFLHPLKFPREAGCP